MSVGTYFGSQSSLVEAVSLTVLPWQASTQLLEDSPDPASHLPGGVLALQICTGLQSSQVFTARAFTPEPHSRTHFVC